MLCQLYFECGNVCSFNVAYVHIQHILVEEWNLKNRQNDDLVKKKSQFIFDMIYDYLAPVTIIHSNIKMASS